MATSADELKDLIPDPTKRIRLDDVVSEKIRSVLKATALEHFPVQGGAAPAKDALEQRLKSYEAAVADLQTSVILLSRWADGEGLLLLEKVFTQLAGADKGSAGFTLWIHLGWYPLQILMYAGGIAALSARRFDSLRTILMAAAPQRDETRGPVVIPVSLHMADASESWKLLPGYERRHTPKSDYLFEILQARLDELLMLGGSYEPLFDEFELFTAIAHVHATGRDWGPIGRFGWKRNHDELILGMVERAQKEKSSWPPLKAGLFNGSADEFCKAAEVLRQRVNSIGWW